MKKYNPVGSDRGLQEIKAGLAGKAFQAEFDSLEQQVGAYKFDDARQTSNPLGENLEGPKITQLLNVAGLAVLKSKSSKEEKLWIQKTLPASGRPVCCSV